MINGVDTWAQSKKTPIERWEEKVERPNGPKGCWIWQSKARNPEFKVAGVSERAVRWGYRHFIGEIPQGKQCIKTCDTERCVSPQHFILLGLREAVSKRRRKAEKKKVILEKPENTSCVHHWVLPPPHGPESIGICRKCDSSSSFPNTLPTDGQWMRPFDRQSRIGRNGS